jgi:uncharacterized protein involved in exopolysaccharide biosynthesis
MDTTTAFRALRRGRVLIVAGAVTAAVVAAFMSGIAAPVYETSATFIVSPAQTDVAGFNDTVRTIDDPRSRAVLSTYVEVLASDTVRLAAAESLALDPEVLEEYEIRAVALPEANVAELTVTGPNEDLLPLLTETVGEIGGERFVELYGVYRTIALDFPSEAGAPINRGPVEAAALGAALGLLIGGALALLIHAPRERHRREAMSRIDAYGETGATVTRLPSGSGRRAARTG